MAQRWGGERRFFITRKYDSMEEEGESPERMRQYTEVSCLCAVDPIAYRDDGVEVVELYLPFYRSEAFLLNLCNFCTSCLLV